MTTEDAGAVETRISRTLRRLLDDEALRRGTPPPWYLRHHLAEHTATSGEPLRTTLTPAFLPYTDLAITRSRLKGKTSQDDRFADDLLRSVQHLWDDDAPLGNAAALGLWSAGLGGGSDFPALWRPRWTQWRARPHNVLTGHTDWVTGVACTVLDGRPVAVTTSHDATVRVWDLAEHTPLGDPLTGHTDAVTGVACTVLDGRPVAVTTSHDHTVRVWDLAEHTPLGDPLTGHTDAVTGVACTVLDGRPVAVTTSHDHTVRVWDLAEHTPLGDPLTGHTDAVTGVACTVLDGRPVAVTTSDDATVRVWDLADHTPLGDPLTGHTDAVTGVACTVLDGRPVAVTTSDDHTVRVWDLAEHTPLGPPTPLPFAAGAVALGPTPHTLLIAMASYLTRFDLNQGVLRSITGRTTQSRRRRS